MRGFPNILSAAQTRKADAYTIENEPIASIDLMERASNAFVKAFCELEKTSATIAVLCGPGNNGGDGLAISRLLQSQGYQAKPYLLQLGKQLSVDCQSNFERLSKVTLLDKEAPIPDFSVFDVVIDALFGSGLQRPLAGYLATLVDAVNQSGARVYSVDIASGLFCDTILDNPVAIKADMVISFQRPKMAFFYPEYGPFIKHWKVVDIGLDETFMEGLESQEFVLDLDYNPSVPQKSSLLKLFDGIKKAKRQDHEICDNCGSKGQLKKVSAIMLCESCRYQRWTSQFVKMSNNEDDYL